MKVSSACPLLGGRTPSFSQCPHAIFPRGCLCPDLSLREDISQDLGTSEWPHLKILALNTVTFQGWEESGGGGHDLVHNRY